MLPCTRKLEVFGWLICRPSSPAMLPSVRIALPGRLQLLSDGHWIRTADDGSELHVTAAEVVPSKDGSDRVLDEPKQFPPAVDAPLRMLLIAAWTAPSASAPVEACPRRLIVVRRLVSANDSSAPSTTATTEITSSTRISTAPSSSCWRFTAASGGR